MGSHYRINDDFYLEVNFDLCRVRILSERYLISDSLGHQLLEAVQSLLFEPLTDFTIHRLAGICREIIDDYFAYGNILERK